jgi:hypothetical protein
MWGCGASVTPLMLNPSGVARQRHTADSEERGSDGRMVMLTKAERLIDEMIPTINRIPKYQRYRYGARLEDALWEIVRRIVEAGYSGQKSKVMRLEEQIRFTQSLLRFGYNSDLLMAKSVGRFSAAVGELLAMTRAWKSRLK